MIRFPRSSVGCEKTVPLSTATPSIPPLYHGGNESPKATGHKACLTSRWSRVRIALSLHVPWHGASSHICVPYMIQMLSTMITCLRLMDCSSGGFRAELTSFDGSRLYSCSIMDLVERKGGIWDTNLRLIFWIVSHQVQVPEYRGGIPMSKPISRRQFLRVAGTAAAGVIAAACQPKTVLVERGGRRKRRSDHGRQRDGDGRGRIRRGDQNRTEENRRGHGRGADGPHQCPGCDPARRCAAARSAVPADPVGQARRTDRWFLWTRDGVPVQQGLSAGIWQRNADHVGQGPQRRRRGLRELAAGRRRLVLGLFPAQGARIQRWQADHCRRLGLYLPPLLWQRL